jgi:hypothetical protein
MKRMIFLSTMLFVLGGARHTRADFVSSSGVECVANYPSDRSYSKNYVTNPSSAAILTVNCPLNLGAIATTTASLTQVIVRYVDNSNSEAVSCIVYRQTPNGQAPTHGNTVYSCNVAGGCGSPDANHTEVGGYLILSPPSTTISIDDSVTLQCNIPKIRYGAESGIIVYYAQ